MADSVGAVDDVGDAVAVSSPALLSLHGEHRFAPGDAAGFSDPHLDDSHWSRIQIPGSADAQGLERDDGRGWLRIHFSLPPALAGRELAVDLGIVWGADETFLNGHRIGGEGVIGDRPVLPYNVQRTYAVPESRLRASNVLAVRIQNGFDPWGLINGPVRVGDREMLLRVHREREQRVFVIDTALIVASSLAFVLGFAGWLLAPRSRVLAYTLGGLAGLVFVCLVPSLPFYRAGWLTPAVYSWVAPVQTSCLPLAIIGAILFLSGRRWRVFDLWPLACVVVGTLWLLAPSLALLEGLTRVWLGICVVLSVAFGVELVLAAKHRSEETPLLVGCSLAVLCVGALAILWARKGDQADFVMRYPIVIVYWLIPAFTLLGLGQRLLRTRARLVSLSAQVISAQAEERRRLSRELHDGVAQDLQAARLGLQMSRAKGNDGAAAVSSAIEVVAGSIESLRAAAQDLRPLGDDRSLAESLRRYLEILSYRSGIPIAFQDDGGSDLERRAGGGRTAEHLYRIAQEAVGNALRHGDASRIDVTLDGRGSELRMIVSDDGTGFDESAVEPGLGLSTIRERAALIGGRCAIGSGDAGTRVDIRVPLDSRRSGL